MQRRGLRAPFSFRNEGIADSMLGNYVKRILQAHVYAVANETPLDHAARLSERLGNEIYLKREDLQPVFSFKLRGAYNKMVMLSERERADGVIAASAGNHAQGVALAAARLGMRALIVMPKTTPSIKVGAVKARGAQVVLHGDSYDEAYGRALEIAAEQGMTFIHPFDDPDVIAGQGTIAMELVRQQQRPIDYLFVPVGGGGLIGGIAAYMKYVSPETRIIGVEPDDAPSMYTALRRKRRVSLRRVGIFADGVAVKQVGKHTFKLAQNYIDDMVLNSVDEICAAVKDVFDEVRTIPEPAGALAVAGMKKYLVEQGVENAHCVALVSGANINFDRLRHVAERAELGERREALFAVRIPERPGSFLRFSRVLGQRPITEFNYRYGDPEQAHVFCGVGLRDGDTERETLIERLEGKGYEVTDLTDNEMAKLHVRYMVGGRAPDIDDEVVFRFQFPELPGALQRFLSHIGRRWNISLFHYRNHGAAYGRVLVGIQLGSGDKAEFEKSMLALDYPFVEETDNPAYRIFAPAGTGAI